MIILGIILCAIGLAAATFFFYKIKHQIKIDNSTIEKNKKEQENLKKIQNEIEKKENEVASLNQQINIYKNYQENNEEIMKQSYERYSEALEKDYIEKEKEYEQYCLTLKNSYDTLQDNAIKASEEQKIELSEYFQTQSEEIKKKLNAAIEELNKVQATRAAAIEAQKRENEIKQKIDFYCLHLSETDQKTIDMINELKPRLPDPRILSMLVWQTFFQKQMNTLCANVLGTEKICGIYKITNQIDGLCYIGQAVDMASRWKEHAKCGLDIDRPAQNKLYSAMVRDGLCAFSFELLEQCPKEQLNLKEKFYITLYQSCAYGYNSTVGNK